MEGCQYVPPVLLTLMTGLKSHPHDTCKVDPVDGLNNKILALVRTLEDELRRRVPSSPTVHETVMLILIVTRELNFTTGSTAGAWKRAFLSSLSQEQHEEALAALRASGQRARSDNATNTLIRAYNNLNHIIIVFDGVIREVEDSSARMSIYSSSIPNRLPFGHERSLLCLYWSTGETQCRNNVQWPNKWFGRTTKNAKNSSQLCMRRSLPCAHCYYLE